MKRIGTFGIVSDAGNIPALCETYADGECVRIVIHAGHLAALGVTITLTTDEAISLRKSIRRAILANVKDGGR